MFLTYLVPYFIMIFAGISNPWLVLLLWVIMSLGMSGIGLNIMHDANHGSFSKNRRLNSVMAYSLNILGGSAYIWKLQHNVLHHTYTNVHGADHDIKAPFLFRFSPSRKPLKIHRAQHLYAWFFYSFMSLSFVSSKDFLQMKDFREMGLIKTPQEYRNRMNRIILSKVLYVLLIIVLPILVVPVPFWITLLGFLIMHMICGFILSIIFQTAHVMPDCEFPEPDNNGVIDENWAVHQMLTTTNYAPKSRIFSWFVGGLNFQVEHHLFSNISHVHYKDLSVIVKATAEKYGIPYNTKPNFISALVAHTKMLYQLGREELMPIPVKK
ncbi:MAG: acyl-CoA desaturase [Bacteroidetes bacterium]|nr:acyl-CoA desaturase [Bacteroidota bacterium]